MEVKDNDLNFLRKILPSHYEISIKGNNCISCKSSIGIKNKNSEDEEHWEYIFKAIRNYFDKRFSEVYHNTCTFHLDFYVYLRSI